MANILKKRESTKMTPKREAFCRAYIETGGNGTEAYRRAYDGTRASPHAIGVETYRILKMPVIQARIREMQDMLMEHTKITVDTIIAELEEARSIALHAGVPQTSAAVSASLGKAKLLGLFEADNKQKTDPIGALIKALGGKVLTPKA